MFFITNFVTCVTNLLTRVTKFVTCIRNFVTNFLSADSENYHGLRKNFLAGSKKYLHVNEPISGQDKSFISDGFEVQTIHSQRV